MAEILGGYLDKIEKILNYILNIINNYLIGSTLFLKENFTNREISYGIILLIALIGILIISCKNNDIREKIKSIIELIFNLKISIPILSMFIYFILMIRILYLLRFWEYTMWKSSIIWFISTAIILMINTVTKKDIKNKDFINMLKDCFKVFILVQYLINMGSFSLIWELVITTLILIISIVNTLIECYEDLQNEGGKLLYKLLNSIKYCIGIIVVLKSIDIVFASWGDIEVIMLIKDIALPSILTIMFIPFIYVLVLYSSYEKVFRRLGFKKTFSNDIRRYLYFKVVLTCNFNIEKINSFTRDSKIMFKHINTRQDVKELIREYKLKDSLEEGV